MDKGYAFHPEADGWTLVRNTLVIIYLSHCMLVCVIGTHTLMEPIVENEVVTGYHFLAYQLG